MKTDTSSSLGFRAYPSTKALQCFETAARHSSFTYAAQEMHMTQSAVSKQVTQLEEMLNTALFYRTSRQISLTPAGKVYYIEVLNILKHIEAATTNLLSHNDDSELLRIVSHPTLSSRWLIPALKGFSEEHHSINLEIIEQVGPFFSEDQNVDIAFLYGTGIWDGMETVKLFDEYSIAVCSPTYFQNRDICFKNINNYNFIQFNSRPNAWYEYFKQQDLNIEGTIDGPRFDTFQACISAALAGYGIALVPSHFIESELQTKDLVKVFDYVMQGRGSYYVTYPLSLGNSYKVRMVLEWLSNYIESYIEPSSE